MNLLIVDDEYYSVEGIKQKLLTSELPIDNIFCAYSMEEAQRIFLNHKVDILLSDIEMPKGSGLDLLAWVRNHHDQVICIILTCYAKFDYASQALKLQSSDYLLKPIGKEELIASVQKAIDRVFEQEKKKEQSLQAQYWLDNKPRAMEEFWHKLALGKLSPSPGAVYDELRFLHLPTELAQAKWFPVLLDCIKTKESVFWEESLYEYALKNILNEVLFSSDEIPVVPNVGEGQYLILLYPRDASEIKEKMADIEKALKCCSSVLPGIFHFFPSDLCDIETIASVCAKCQSLAKNTIFEGNLIFDPAHVMIAPQPIPQPPWDNWNELLLSRKMSDIEQKALCYLSSLRHHPHARRKDLITFHHDFLQMIYSFLDKSGSFAHDLFHDLETESKSEKACDSIDEMCSWVSHMISESNRCLSMAAQSSSTLESIKQYIENHITEELNRDQISAAVFLSPDYISHLFAEKEGMSLTAYITMRRIHRAKELLYNTHLSIRDVATESGFSNISYFSKQFKRHTGQTPQEFRKAKFS